MKKIGLMSVILISFLSISSVQAFDQIIVFGDNLSDEGYQDQNPFTVTDGKTPLWTTPNGHTWVYYLAKNIGVTPPTPNNINPPLNNNYVSGTLKGTDYAAGGATSGEAGYVLNANISQNYNPPSLVQQVCQYMTGLKQSYDQCTLPTNITADPRALYIISIGTNDILSMIATAKNNSVPVCSLLTEDLFNQITQDVVFAINKLQSGSTVPLRILVMGLPDIGATPFGRLVLPIEGCSSAQISGAIASFNTILSSAINSISTSDVVYVDTFSLMDSLQQNYSFANTKLPACSMLTDLALNCIPTMANADHYMFEDSVNLTSLTHSLLAEQFYANLKSIGWVS